MRKPEEILTRDALMRGNITETSEQTENHQLSFLAEQFKAACKEGGVGVNPQTGRFYAFNTAPSKGFATTEEHL